eukprot:397400-Hanusia_phi.AAC.4
MQLPPGMHGLMVPRQACTERDEPVYLHPVQRRPQEVPELLPIQQHRHQEPGYLREELGDHPVGELGVTIVWGLPASAVQPVIDVGVLALQRIHPSHVGILREGGGGDELPEPPPATQVLHSIIAKGWEEPAHLLVAPPQRGQPFLRTPEGSLQGVHPPGPFVHRSRGRQVRGDVCSPGWTYKHELVLRAKPA